MLKSKKIKKVLYILIVFFFTIPLTSFITGSFLIAHPANLYACEGDFDNDGDVDGKDLTVFSADFDRIDCSGGAPCQGDFDDDGDVDNDDLTIFSADFGKNDCPIGYAPEDTDLGFAFDEQQGGGGLVGATIRILNGNALEYRRDLSFPSPHSHDLVFRAFYNSRSTTIGALGHGWSHNYAVSLDPVFDLNGTTYLKVIEASGRACYFQDMSGGIYTGAFNELSQVISEAGEFIWLRLDGTRLTFSASGRLLNLEDEKGNFLQLTYSGDFLQTVSDNSTSRNLTFHYNAGNRLEQITGPITGAVADGIWVSYGYDLNDNLTTVTYADGSGFSYTYNDSNDIHNLTEKRNSADHLLKTFAYDTYDRAIDNFCGRGRGVSINYLNETSAAVSDAYGTLRTYTLGRIDERKRVTAMTGAASAPYSDNHAISWNYDEKMRLTEVEYAGGTINRYSDYDERGNPATVTLAQGSPAEKSITYTYHPNMNRPLTRTEAGILGSGNRVTVWDYDDDGNSTANQNPTNFLTRTIIQGYTGNSSGGTIPYEYITTLSYNTKGQLLTFDGPLTGSDDTTSFNYDTIGDLLGITRPLIGSTTFANYDSAGQLGLLTDVNNRTTAFQYDGKNRITTITHNADGSSSNTTYNTAGLTETITDPDGISKSFIYDTQYGRLLRITADDGSYIVYDYDSQGNLIEMSYYNQADIRTLRKRWDYQGPTIPGKLWKEINPDNTFTEYDYDSAGNISTITDPKSQTSQYTYDALNHLTTATRPGSVTTTYSYDHHNNLTSISDPKLNLTTYTYDDQGRVIAVISPDSGTTTYIYDSADNLSQKSDAKGITITYTHDLLDRLTATNFPDSSQDISLSYDTGSDGKGRLTGMTDPSGSTTFAYDNRGRLTTKTSTIDAHSYLFSRAFSPGNRRTSITYPSGRTLTYGRNAFGQIVTVATTLGGTTTTLFENLNYQPFGSPTAVDTGAGGSADNHFDENYRLATANPGATTERTYAYDGNNNLTARSFPSDPGQNRNFTYDPLNRLTAANGPYGALSYSYDKTGNRLTRTIDGQLETYTYVSNTNRILEITGTNPVSFTHDANGNLTTSGNLAFFYNQNNRLIRAEQNSTILAEYTYNGNHQRIKKIADGATTLYHYGFNNTLLGESLPDGTFTAEHLYMGSVRIASVDSDTFYYYLNDYLGTPQVVVDDTKAAVWEASYKPFGETQIHNASSIENNFRLPGQLFDTETGLHYNYHRYYNPRTGRYLTPDPIGLAGGSNLYTYAQNNPVNLIDPLGLKTWQIGLGFNAGGLVGSTKSAGLIIGHNPKTGNWDFAFYATGGAGAHGGASASLTIDITTSDNPCIEDVIGWTGTAGGSVNLSEVITAGYERNTPTSDALPSNTYSFGVGVGTPVEGHGYATYTKIWGSNK